MQTISDLMAFRRSGRKCSPREFMMGGMTSWEALPKFFIITIPRVVHGVASTINGAVRTFT
jgi:hypothetical protein